MSKIIKIMFNMALKKVINESAKETELVVFHLTQNSLNIFQYFVGDFIFVKSYFLYIISITIFNYNKS